MNPARLLPAYFVVFAGFVGFSMMITVFTPMFLHGYGRLVPAELASGSRTILLGVVLCIYPLGQFLSAPVIGALSDKYGRRPVLIISLMLSIVCYGVLAGAIALESLPLLIPALMAAGLAEGNIVIAQSAISDVSDDAGRGRLFGYIYMSASLAYVAGPLLGGALVSSRSIPWFSYATPFEAMLLVLAATLAGVVFFFRETRLHKTTGPVRLGAALTTLGAVFRPGGLRILYFANFACYLGLFGFLRCYPMYLVDEFHMDVSQVSWFIAWVAVPIILGNLFLAGFVLARFPAEKVTLWSGALTAVAMVAIIVPASPKFLWVTLFLAGLPLAICLTSCATMLSVAAPAEEQGVALGNNQALQVFAESTSGLAGGLIAAILVKASLPAMGMFILIGLAILVAGRRGPARQGAQPPQLA